MSSGGETDFHVSQLLPLPRPLPHGTHSRRFLLLVVMRGPPVLPLDEAGFQFPGNLALKIRRDQFSRPVDHDYQRSILLPKPPAWRTSQHKSLPRNNCFSAWFDAASCDFRSGCQPSVATDHQIKSINDIGSASRSVRVVLEMISFRGIVAPTI